MTNNIQNNNVNNELICPFCKFPFDDHRENRWDIIENEENKEYNLDYFGESQKSLIILILRVTITFYKYLIKFNSETNNLLDANHVIAAVEIMGHNFDKNTNIILYHLKRKHENNALFYIKKCKESNIKPDNFDKTKNFIEKQFSFIWFDRNLNCPNFTDDFIILWCFMLRVKECVLNFEE